MGAADVVPGVSGGTIAFVTGIYEELIYSIRSVDRRFVRLLLALRLREALNRVPWRFLGPVLVGILLAVVSLARGIQWMLHHRPELIWAFFFGLVVASVFVVRKRVVAWRGSTWIAVFAAGLLFYVVVGLVPVKTPDSPWFLLLCGVIAISAMILPGISGSFILVLLGKYEYLLTALNNRDLFPIVLFTAGAAIGILSVARVLAWIFRRHHDLTVATLTGFMAGSLRKIWPWKANISALAVDAPLVQLNVLPRTIDGELAAAVGLAVMGFAVVFVLNRLSACRR
jgi:putative membrane protein